MRSSFRPLAVIVATCLAASISGAAVAGSAAAWSPAPIGEGRFAAPVHQAAADAARPQPPGPLPAGRPAPAVPQPQTTLPTAVEPVVALTPSSVNQPPREQGGFDPVRSVEQVGDRRADMKVFLNPNGTRTAIAYTGPVHYRDALGGWSDIDTSVVSAADGTFRPRASGTAVSLARNARDGGLVSVAVDAVRSVAYRLDGAASTAGVASGSTVRYAGVRPSTDLELAAFADGVKETLVLTSRSAPTVFTFPLTLRGLSPVLTDNGDIAYLDGDGVERARSPKGFMTDSSTNPVSGEGVTSRGVTYSLVPWGTGTALRLTLDKAWLDDPARVYPVLVDPTTVVKLTDSDDTYVQTGYTANNSLETEVKIGTPNSVPNTAYTYLHFGGINSTYNDYYVNTAGLSLYEVHSATCTPRAWSVYTAKSSWSAATITAANAPAYDTPALSTVSSAKGSTCGGAGWAPAADVTNAVQGWLHGKANYGLTVRANSSTDSTYWKRFASYQGDGVNHTSAPQIKFTYSREGALYAPSAQFAVAPTNNRDGKLNITVTNYGRDAWPANGAYRLSYHLYDGVGNLIDWDGARTLMPTTVNPRQSVNLSAKIDRLAPGSYRIVWDMVHETVTWFSSAGVKVPTAQAFTVPNYAPYVTAVNSPADLAAVTTTTPRLSVTATDPDAYPATGALQYYFRVCTGSNAESGTCFNSGWTTSSSWTLPANSLYWRKTYYWHTYVKDAGGAQTNPTWVWRFTPVVSDTSSDAHFGADPYGLDDGGVNISVGNFVTSAVDAPVATVGPGLSATRTYNSQDSKVGAFGTGWSSLFDVKATADASGNVTVVHGDGRRAKYGRNPDGTYAASYGYYATLVASIAGGWYLTEKDHTSYTFDASGGLVNVWSPLGKRLTISSNATGSSTVTDNTSGRALTLTWTGGRITSVATDAVTDAGGPLVWRYNYTGNQLTVACDPRENNLGGSCVTYEYAGAGGRLSKVTLPRGNMPIRLEYYTDGTVLRRTDGEGHTWTYGYTLNAVDGSADKWEKRIRRTDPRTNTIEYAFDGETNRLLRRTDAAGKVRTFRYDTTTGYFVGITDENLHELAMTVDDRGNVLTRAVPYGTGTATTYYSYVYTEDDTDPRNNKLQMVRDARSSGPTDTRYQTFYGYDPDGQLTNIVTPPTPEFPNGTVRTWRYLDGTEPGWAGTGGTMPAKLLGSYVDGRGATTNYRYNSKGDLLSVVRAGAVTNYTYDELGRKSTESVYPRFDNIPATTTYRYDRGGAVAQIDYPAALDVTTNITHTRRVTYGLDANSVVRDITESDLTGGDPQRSVHFDVDSNDRVTLERDATGAVTTRTYDPAGNLDTITAPGGQTHDFDHDVHDRVMTLTARGVVDDPSVPTAPHDVVLARFTYDAAGRLDAATDVRGVVHDYAWYDNDLLQSVTVLDYDNHDGTRRSIATEWHGYDPAGNETLTKTGGYLSTVSRVFDAAGWLSSETTEVAPRPRTVTFRRDGAGNVLTRSLSDGTRTEETRYTYNYPGWVASVTVENGDTDLTTTYDRNAYGQVTKICDPRGNAASPADPAYETTIAYDQLSRAVSVTGPQITAESPGQAAAVVRPVTTFGYDTYGNRTRVVDPRGNTYRSDYDPAGRIVSRTWPTYTPPGAAAVVAAETVDYTAAGDVESVTDRRGATTTFTYDTLRRLIRRADPKPDPAQAEPVTRWRYSDGGDLAAVTDPTGAVTEYGYDDLARVRALTEVVRNGTATPNRYTTTFDYNDLGDLTKTAAARGDTRYDDYNAASELIQHQDAAGFRWLTSRDVAGRVSRLTDPVGRHLDLTYDLAGRGVTAQTYSASNTPFRTENATYDAAGNVTSYTPAAPAPGATTAATRSYAWDAANLLTSLTEPTSTTQSIVTSFGYDKSGNRTRITDGNGNTTTTSYTVWNLPETVLEPATAQHPAVADRQYVAVYDRGGLPVEDRRPGGVAITRTFDDLGRLLRQTGTGAPGDKQYGYDLAGRLTAASHPAGTQTFGYDDRGLLTTSTGPAGASSATYDSNGWPASRTDAAGTTTLTWDPRGLPKTISDPVTTSTQALAYWPDSQIKSRQYGTAGPLRSYGYDDAGRLASDTVTTATGATTVSAQYQYTTEGNLARATYNSPAGGGGTYGYDLADRLTTWTPPGGTATTYTYDNAGNRTSAGSTSHTYNQRNQLVSDSTGTTYGYTPRGTLATRTNGATTTTTVFDAFDRITGDGATANTYDALDRLSAAGGLAFSYHGVDLEPSLAGSTAVARDGAGSPIAIKVGALGSAVFDNPHGDVVATMSTVDGTSSASTGYDPFGKTRSGSGSASPFGFQGQYTAASGQVHMQTRWYDPATGTFNSRDTLAMSAARAGGANRYAYGLGNVVTLADPTGMFTCAPCKAVTTIVAGGAGAISGAANQVLVGAAVGAAQVAVVVGGAAALVVGPMATHAAYHGCEVDYSLSCYAHEPLDVSVDARHGPGRPQVQLGPRPGGVGGGSGGGGGGPSSQAPAIPQPYVAGPPPAVGPGTYEPIGIGEIAKHPVQMKVTPTPPAPVPVGPAVTPDAPCGAGGDISTCSPQRRGTLAPGCKPLSVDAMRSCTPEADREAEAQPSPAADGAGAAGRAPGDRCPPDVNAPTDGHHTVPRQILKVLPPEVANHPLVRGTQGAPNIWQIPRPVHRAIHRGPYGGLYNEAWFDGLSAIDGKDPTVQDVLRLRDEITARFGIDQYRPKTC